jgi:hypothetical protein
LSSKSHEATSEHWQVKHSIHQDHTSQDRNSIS